MTSTMMSHIYRLQRSLGQGYIFTGVCHSVNRGGGVSASGGRVSTLGGCLLPGSLVLGGLLLGGCCSGGSAPGGVGGSGPGGSAWWRHPPGRPLLRTVRILLECILVPTKTCSCPPRQGPVYHLKRRIQAK